MANNNNIIMANNHYISSFLLLLSSSLFSSSSCSLFFFFFTLKTKQSFKIMIRKKLEALPTVNTLDFVRRHRSRCSLQAVCACGTDFCTFGMHVATCIHGRVLQIFSYYVPLFMLENIESNYQSPFSLPPIHVNCPSVCQNGPHSILHLNSYDFREPMRLHRVF